MGVGAVIMLVVATIDYRRYRELAPILYGVMLVSPAKHTHVKQDLGQQFIDWLVSPEGQKAIADYKINGEQLFYPNANDSGA